MKTHIGRWKGFLQDTLPNASTLVQFFFFIVLKCKKQKTHYFNRF